MKQIKELLDRYYDGNTTLEEEELVRNYLASHPEETEKADGLLFAGINALKKNNTPVIKKNRRIGWRTFMIAGTSLAAGLALLIGLRQKPLSTQTEVPQNLTTQILVDPKISGEIKNEEQALEQARKALAYVSNQLNKGTAGIGQLNHLEKSMSKIQTKEKS